MEVKSELIFYVNGKLVCLFVLYTSILLKDTFLPGTDAVNQVLIFLVSEVESFQNVTKQYSLRKKYTCFRIFNVYIYI